MAESAEAPGDVIQTLLTVMALDYAPYLTGLAITANKVKEAVLSIESYYSNLAQHELENWQAFGTASKEAAEELFKDQMANVEQLTGFLMKSGLAIIGTATLVAISWNKVADSVEHATHAGERLHTTSEYLRAWSAASVMAGQNADAFGNSIESLHKRINEMSIMPPSSIAGMMSGGMRPLTMLGLNPWMMRGMGANEQLSLIADRLSLVTDETLRLQLAQELLGDSAFYMMKYLKDGSVGIKEMQDHFKELNLTLNQGQTEGINNSLLAWRDLKLAVTGIFTQVAAAAAPGLTVLFNMLSKLAQFIGQVFSYVGVVLQVVWAIFKGMAITVEYLASCFPRLSSFIGSTVSFVLFLAAALLALKIIMLIMTYVVIPGFTIAIAVLTFALTQLSAVLMAMASNPWVWIGAAIAVVLLLILYATGALEKLKNAMGFGNIDVSGSLSTPMASSSMASAETNQILSSILATNKGQYQNSIDMLKQLSKASPPHMPYSW